MQLQIHTEGVTLNAKDENYLNKKIMNLQKYGERISDESVIAKIDIRQDLVKTSTSTISLHVTIYMPKALIRAAVSSRSIKECADGVVEKLKKQLEKYKHKLTTKLVDVPQEFRSLSAKIVKRKLFSHVIPMSEEEAITQMEMLNHDFFIFANEKTRLYNVLYKRAKGGYGLIELATQDAVI